MSRKSRGVTQTLFLIETLPVENEEKRKFAIMGTTGNAYIVTIQDDPSCTCPDFVLRGNRCKHIYFVLLRVMKCDNEEEIIYDKEDLKIMFDNIPKVTSNLIADKEIRDLYKTIANSENLENEEEDNDEKEEEDEKVKKKSTDDVCPICLDSLENGVELDYCKNSCGKFIHKLCFSMWCKKNHATCVFCRSDWAIKINNLDALSYVNLKSKIKDK